MVIHDRKLGRHEAFKKWAENQPLVYAVTAGEKIKNLEDFPGHLKKISKMLSGSSPKSTVFVAIGGGALGDFAGFAASVFKRGVPLIHIPTTFLAAIDSAHGGKTSLNLAGFKNLVGNFYPAKAVMIVKSLLQTLGPKEIQSASGNLAKMAFISGGEFCKELVETDLSGFDLLWKFLPQAVNAKYEIIEKDPVDQLGDLQVLNLGHTFGHAFEVQYDLPHGISVGLGLAFTIRWSHHRGYFKFEEMNGVLDFLHDQLKVQKPEGFFKNHKKTSKSRLRKLLLQDKKLTDRDHINFVFLNRVGEAFTKRVTIDSFLTEAHRQGWVNG